MLDNCRTLGINLNIKYVFGSFNTKWNSGRTVYGGNPDVVICKQAIDLYNSLGISTRFTFSNHLLQEKDLEDPICNAALEYMNQKNQGEGFENGVIVVSDLLTSYIRKNYPFIKITSSLYKSGLETNFETDTCDYYNRLMDIYDMVVIDTNKVKDHNISFLEGIKDKNKAEFIANNHCARHCKNVGKHDEAVARAQLAISAGDKIRELYWQSKIDKYMEICNKKYLADPENTLLCLTNDEMEMLIDMGYTHFKLQGRAASKEEFFEDVAIYLFADTESNHSGISRKSY